MLPHHYEVSLSVATLCQLGAELRSYLVTIVNPDNKEPGLTIRPLVPVKDLNRGTSLVFIIKIVENTDNVCNVNEWSVIMAGSKSAQGM
jgi:hypothetical protein